MNTGEALQAGWEYIGAIEADTVRGNTLCSFGVAVLTFLDQWDVGSWKQWIVKIVAGWLRGYLKEKGCIQAG